VCAFHVSLFLRHLNAVMGLLMKLQILNLTPCFILLVYLPDVP
jgi:hypothetical protein